MLTSKYLFAVEPIMLSSLPSSISVPTDRPLDTDNVLLMVWFPVRANVDPLNVRLPLSSISPEAPAITTRLFVRSDTLRLFITAPP